jgi:hypothetical protein
LRKRTRSGTGAIDWLGLTLAESIAVSDTGLIFWAVVAESVAAALLYAWLRGPVETHGQSSGTVVGE